jgi:hypothetical protein
MALDDLAEQAVFGAHCAVAIPGVGVADVNANPLLTRHESHAVTPTTRLRNLGHEVAVVTQAANRAS